VDRCRPTLAHQMPSGGGHIINAPQLIVEACFLLAKPSRVVTNGMQGLVQAFRPANPLQQQVPDKVALRGIVALQNPTTLHPAFHLGFRDGE
uniref:hypothetical protein n=1 Tax=Paracoccus sp. TaxID=267 RepID=UPI00396C62B8